MANRFERALRRAATRALREPFVHFMILGALTYCGVHAERTESERYRITVEPPQIARLRDTYRRQYGREPDREQLRALIDQSVREEIFFREGNDLDLAKEDQIVRRRVAQKFEFLQLDPAPTTATDRATLRTYYAAHAVNYRSPAKLSFTHVYFATAPDDPAPPSATMMREELTRLHAERGASRGDRFAGPSDYLDLDATSLAHVFGESPIIGALLDAPLNGWVGPVRSAYGWHLIRVSAREAAAPLPFEQVQDRVADDYREQLRRDAKSEAFARLKSKYLIVIDDSVRG